MAFGKETRSLTNSPVPSVNSGLELRSFSKSSDISYEVLISSLVGFKAGFSNNGAIRFHFSPFFSFKGSPSPNPLDCIDQSSRLK